MKLGGIYDSAISSSMHWISHSGDKHCNNGVCWNKPNLLYSRNDFARNAGILTFRFIWNVSTSRISRSWNDQHLDCVYSKQGLNIKNEQQATPTIVLTSEVEDLFKIASDISSNEFNYKFIGEDHPVWN